MGWSKWVKFKHFNFQFSRKKFSDHFFLINRCTTVVLKIQIALLAIWKFQNPTEPGIAKKKYPPITYEYAQEEIAAKAGIQIAGGSSGGRKHCIHPFILVSTDFVEQNFKGVISLSGDDLARLQDDLIEVMPAVEEANSISEELDKRVKFEIILISPQMLATLNHKHEGFEGRDKTSEQAEVINLCTTV